MNPGKKYHGVGDFVTFLEDLKKTGNNSQSPAEDRKAFLHEHAYYIQELSSASVPQKAEMKKTLINYVTDPDPNRLDQAFVLLLFTNLLSKPAEPTPVADAKREPSVPKKTEPQAESSTLKQINNLSNITSTWETYHNSRLTQLLLDALDQNEDRWLKRVVKNDINNLTSLINKWPEDSKKDFADKLLAKWDNITWINSMISAKGTPEGYQAVISFGNSLQKPYENEQGKYRMIVSAMTANLSGNEKNMQSAMEEHEKLYPSSEHPSPTR